MKNINQIWKDANDISMMMLEAKMNIGKEDSIEYVEKLIEKTKMDIEALYETINSDDEIALDAIRLMPSLIDTIDEFKKYANRVIDMTHDEVKEYEGNLA
jgi:hypothetical protein